MLFQMKGKRDLFHSGIMTDISFDRVSTPCLASSDGSLQPQVFVFCYAPPLETVKFTKQAKRKSELLYFCTWPLSADKEYIDNI